MIDNKKIIDTLKTMNGTDSYKAVMSVIDNMLLLQRDANIVGNDNFEITKFVFYREGAITELQRLKDILEYPEKYGSN